jgi:hypothetical protein
MDEETRSAIAAAAGIALALVVYGFLVVIPAVWTLPAAAEMNTVELDAAFEKCRQHMVSQQGEWVWAPGWENCHMIEQAWDLKQGGSIANHEQDKAAVQNMVTKLLGGPQ